MPRLTQRPFLLLALGLLVVGQSGCRVPPAGGLPAVEHGHLHVIVIDGGRDRASNYQSHLAHVRGLLAILGQAHVDPGSITIFASDGADPAADLALREVQPEPTFWLIEDTRLGPLLRTPVTYENSVIPGYTLHAATHAAITAWFDEVARRLPAGDTLLVYVTDHGTRGASPDENKITLWGKDDALTVAELRTMVAALPRRLRVVFLMSQCYSGAFARTGGPPDGAEPAWRGNVCGYFASTADRPAYGCYPENRGLDDVGHSFHFLRALEQSGSFPAAHEAVLVSDDSPDVPLRTSDAFLEDVLRRAAAGTGSTWTALADEMLRQAWADRAAWEPQIRLLDRIAHTFGMFSPRSLAELEDLAQRLPGISGEYRAFARAWRGGFHDGSSANLERFLAAQPAWTPRLDEAALRAASEADRRATSVALLGLLQPFTQRQRAVATRLDLLHRNATLADAIAYRMEIRLGVALRLRALLVDIAARTYLARSGSERDRTTLTKLLECQALTLPGIVPASEAPIQAQPFPPYDEDVAAAKAVQPAWMGIQFKESTAEQRKGSGISDGAAVVVAVYPDSPAAAAGLRSGDLILGPPSAPFTEKNQVRTWTMFAKVDTPQLLLISRDGQRQQITLVPKPFPRKWPELPGPVKVGAAAPLLDLPRYRGSVDAHIPAGSARLLFFWATWCGPCKASVPELLAYERETGTPVIAVTDESRSQLDSFFERFTQPFPATVAMDENRRSFVAYGVSGTPTFALVDGGGTVLATWSGYRREEGLHLPGWTWRERAEAGR